ncbi:Chemotaxis protein MotB [Rickettsiales bacterium Ac37b]|nr:Chemotaxis protein MotB [Rickettsiales bacterium Ac37b]
MSKDSNKTLIIKKIKKSGQAGGHGGTWKLAYADFVTAMMAFFLLLWILNSVSSKKLQGIADYFTPTIGLPNSAGTLQPNTPTQKHSANNSIVFGSPPPGAIIKMPEKIRQTLEQLDARNFSLTQSSLQKAISDNPELKEFSDSIMIDETPEGLRIQLIEQEKRPLFVIGTSKLQPYTKTMLDTISQYIRYMPNYLSIDGHTNKDRTVNRIDSWQLSSERSVMTRRYLINAGDIDSEQIFRVTGYADQDPIDASNPYELRNIRISLVLLRNTIVPFSKQVLPKAVLFEEK